MKKWKKVLIIKKILSAITNEEQEMETMDKNNILCHWIPALLKLVYQVPQCDGIIASTILINPQRACARGL